MKLVIVLSVCAALVYGRIPNGYVTKCDRKGQTMVKCMKSNLESLREYLKEGIPAINIPRLEPFKMKQIEIDAEMPGLILKGEASSIVAYGGSEFKIKDLKANLDTVEVAIVIPKLDVSADYDTYNSQAFLLAADGSGQFKGTFTDVNVKIKIKGHVIPQNGLTYAKIDDLVSEIDFGGASIHVDPDNPSLKDSSVVALINQSSAAVLNKISPVINKAAAPIIKKYLAKILAVVPLDDILKI